MSFIISATEPPQELSSLHFAFTSHVIISVSTPILINCLAFASVYYVITVPEAEANT